MNLPGPTERAIAFLERLERRCTGGRLQLDHYARMARAVADVPIATISFACDGGTQIRGRAAGGAGPARDVPASFCAHALQSTGTVYVPDLGADPRFCDHPQVRDGERYRFYAAAPLIVDAAAAGCLCLLDYQPRELKTAQLRAVRMLADDLQRELNP